MSDYERIKQWIWEHGDFSSAPDKAVFYAANFHEARRGQHEKKQFWYSKELRKIDPEKGTLFKDAPSFKELRAQIYEALDEEGITRNEGESLWKEASHKFAEQAQGKVVILGENATTEDILLTHELPALLKNEKVTEINGVQRAKLESTYKQALRETHGDIEGALLSVNAEICPSSNTFKGVAHRITQLRDLGHEQITTKELLDRVQNGNLELSKSDLQKLSPQQMRSLLQNDKLDAINGIPSQALQREFEEVQGAAGDQAATKAVKERLERRMEQDRRHTQSVERLLEQSRQQKQHEQMQQRQQDQDHSRRR